MRSAVPLVLLTFVLGAAVAAAAAPTANAPKADAQITDGSLERRLDSARKRWSELGPRHYSYKVTKVCFCPQRQGTITVRDRRPVKVSKSLAPLATVPRLFGLVQGFIDDRVGSLQVSYGKRGQPTKITVDPIIGAIDDEVGYVISDFTRLKPRAR